MDSDPSVFISWAVPHHSQPLALFALGREEPLTRKVFTSSHTLTPRKFGLAPTAPQGQGGHSRGKVSNNCQHSIWDSQRLRGRKVICPYMRVSFELSGKHHPDTGLVKHSRLDTTTPKSFRLSGLLSSWQYTHDRRDGTFFHISSRSTLLARLQPAYTLRSSYTLLHLSLLCTLQSHACQGATTPALSFILAQHKPPCKNQLSLSWIIHTWSRNHKTVKYRLNSS